MKKRPAIIVFTTLALMFAWFNQAMAAPCPASTGASMSHSSHAMDAVTLEHGCADCQTETGCAMTSLHCLKVDEKSTAGQKTFKAAPDLVIAPVHITYKIKHHQIRGPGILPVAVAISPKTLNSLHIRLQV